MTRCAKEYQLQEPGTRREDTRTRTEAALYRHRRFGKQRPVLDTREKGSQPLHCSDRDHLARTSATRGCSCRAIHDAEADGFLGRDGH